ncbi:MAG: SSI family serine proteinase inhibitor [Actinomycetota bacterium]
MEEQLRTFQGYPAPKSCRVIDFEHAEVRVLESLPLQYLLVVSGIKPCINMKVELVPLVYIQPPEYWGIEVVGCLPGGICLPALAPYSVDLLNPPLGTRGIEVIGATRSERFEIPPESSPQGCFALSITSKLTGELLAKASLTCNPDGGSHPEPVGACEQLSKVDGRIEAIPPEDAICTLEFNPVILRASGTWNGEDRRFEGVFGNRCIGVRDTGGRVFDFEGAG